MLSLPITLSRLTAWLVVALAAATLISLPYERLLIAWAVVTLVWASVYYAKTNVLPIVFAAILAAVMFILPVPLPAAWPPLARLALLLLVWSLILGAALRWGRRIQTAKRL